MPPESKVMPLPTSATDAGKAAVVFHDDERQRFIRATRYGQERAHLEFAHLGLAEDLHAQALMAAGEVLGGVRQVRRRANVARKVGEIARERDAGPDGGAFLEAAHGSLEVALLGHG